MRFLVNACLAVAVSLPVLGCSSGSPPGELVVEVVTDMSLPKDIDAVRVQILGTNGVTYNDQTYTVGPSGLHIPATIGVLAGSPTDTALVRVTAIHGGTALILREATSEVPANRQALLRLPLEFLCTGSAIDTSMLGSPSSDTIADSCPTGQSCVLGTCRKDAVDVTTLPTYTAGLVFGGGDGGAGAGSCFPTATCFGSAATVTPSSTCTVPVPPGINAAELNVALQTTGANPPGICSGAGPCFIPLDMSATEGWTLNGDTVQLPPGVCKPLNATTPFTVVVSSSCTSKVPSVPTCGPWSSTSAAESTLDGGKLLRGTDGGKDATVDAAKDASKDAAKDAADSGSPTLTALTLPSGFTLDPPLSPTRVTYTVEIPASALGVPFTLSPTAPPGFTFTIDGVPLGDAGTSRPIALQLLTPTVITLVVTPPDPDGSTPPGTTYTFTVPPLQEAYLKAQNERAQSALGTSIAISEDGTTLAVGAPYDDSDAVGINGDGGPGFNTNEGAVYVFTRSLTDAGAGAWSQQAYLKASPGPTNNFGISLALTPDGNTLAVGANYQVGGGGAYVFRRTGTQWAQQGPTLGPKYGDPQLGYAIALSADGNTLALGAPTDASGATGINGDGGQAPVTFNAAGAVYVFTYAPADGGGSAWTLESYIKAPNTAPQAYFGWSVALSANASTLAVGAYGEGSAATGIGGDGGYPVSPLGLAGAVYIYSHSGSGWSAVPTYVKAPATYAGDYFGQSVALSSDGTVLAVGASGDSSQAGINGDAGAGSLPWAGGTFVYNQTGGTWTAPPQYLKPKNPQSYASFGVAVSLSYDGGMLAVGANGENGIGPGINNFDAGVVAGTQTGAVYLFSLGSSGWTEQAYVKPAVIFPTSTLEGGDATQSFGAAVALAAGGSLLAVGSPGDPSPATSINGNETDASAINAGATYVYP